MTKQWQALVQLGPLKISSQCRERRSFCFFFFSLCGWHDMKTYPVLLESFYLMDINRSVSCATDQS